MNFNRSKKTMQEKENTNSRSYFIGVNKNKLILVMRTRNESSSGIHNVDSLEKEEIIELIRCYTTT